MINKDEVTADLKAVETQAEESAGKMGGAFSNLGGIISGLAGPAVIGAVTAAFVGMAKTGFENIKQVEDQMHLFQVATGASAEEAEAFGETIKAMHKVNTDSYEDIGAAVTAVRQRFGDLGEGVQDVTQGFMDYAKVTGQDTVSAMNSVSDVLARFNLPLDEAGGIMDKFKAASEATGIPIGELQSGLEKAGTQFTAMGFSIDESVAMLGAFHKAGVDASTMQRSLNTFMNNTKELSDSQADALYKLGVSLDTVSSANASTVKQAEEYGIELREGQSLTEEMRAELLQLGITFDSTSTLAGTQKEALAEMFETLANGETDVETMQAAMQMFGTRAGPEMVQALQSGTMSIEELMSVLENSEGAVSEASDMFDKQLGERWELIKRKYLEPFMETIGVGLMDLLEFVLNKVDEWGPYIEAGFEFFQETIVPILNVFLDVAQNVFGVVGGLIETLIGVFTGDWDRALQGVKDMWDSVWNGVVALLDGLGLVDAISNMWDSAMAFMRELPQKMIDMGVNIIDGLVTGIKDAVGRPIEAVKEAAGNILGTVKGWFGIQSPSTVMAEVGVNLMEGMAEGINEGANKPIDAISGVADRMKTRFTEAFDQIGRMAESSMVSVGNMLLSGGSGWEKIVVDLLSGVINQLLVAAVGAMGIAELISKAMANMWNPLGWVVIGGLVIALAAIRNKLASDLKGVTGGGGPGGGSGGGGSGTQPLPGTSGGGGTQVSEITGPTRDLLTDLLAPLANFGQIVAPIQDIRSILYERLPNFNNMDFAGAGVGGMGGVTFESGSIVINSSATNSQELTKDLLDQIERGLANRVAFGIRGRGGR